MSVLRKLTHQEIVQRQVSRSQAPRVPLCVVLHNIRSLHNVGAIFRTADGVGVEKIWLTGYTGYPPQSGISKTALGAEQAVPWEYRADILPLLAEIRQRGYQIALLEQMEGSESHDSFNPSGAVCLVLGNEVEGVGEDLVSYCGTAIEIEMAGVKNSLNVAVAFGIVAYALRSRLKKKPYEPIEVV